MTINFKQLAKPYHPLAAQLLSDWIKINSVYDDTTITKNQPFGKGVNDALRYIGEIAKDDGFNVTYNDGYVTEISYGRGPIIGIYAHADVVPVSGSWRFPPFSGTISEDRIYGRGASDDKGPAISSYLALRLLKENHLIDGFTVRLAIGGNEERGSSCLHHYFHHLKKADAVAGFTPDGAFPLIYGEKGIANYKISGQINLDPIIQINAGVVANSVIDRAEVILKRDPLIENEVKKLHVKYEIEQQQETTKLVFFGKAAHGSMPELGDNAGIKLITFLANHYQLATLKKIAHQYADPYGKNLGAYHQGVYLKQTTYNVGLINYQHQFLTMIVNFRYPENVVLETLLKQIAKKTPLPINLLMNSKPLLIDPNSPFIQTLLKAYQEETNDYQSQIMTIGGGTYAKEAANTVAFGSAFPGKNDRIHDVDEKIDLEDLHSSIAIYARAIYELGKLYAHKA